MGIKRARKTYLCRFLNKNFKTNILQLGLIQSQISYKYGRSMYQEVVEPKPNQEIYIYNNKVIKFFNNTEIYNLLLRRHKLLEPHSPQIS